MIFHSTCQDQIVLDLGEQVRVLSSFGFGVSGRLRIAVSELAIKAKRARPVYFCRTCNKVVPTSEIYTFCSECGKKLPVSSSYTVSRSGGLFCEEHAKEHEKYSNFSSVEYVDLGAPNE